jgi:predicted 3-demethylubiquinone-9 3-methyltransferase (glyoxalase superfamily)
MKALCVVLASMLGLSLSAGAPGDQGEPEMSRRQKIVTFLWFDRNAEEAVRLYTSLFKDSKLVSETRYCEGGPLPAGTLMTANFELAGQEFIALNGGPLYEFTEAISLLVHCETQQEIDRLWEKLCADGGEPGQCGWLKDRFGLSWQIVPTSLGAMLSDRDPAKARRVADAMMQMKKLDLRKLKEAYERG